MLIREFREDTDLEGLKNCVIMLQDHERSLDPRMPDGPAIADRYVQHLQSQCQDHDGTIWVAEIDGCLVGYVTLLTSVATDEIDDGDYEYGLISDLAVHESYRGRGIGHALLEHAEGQAIAKGVRWLRVTVMAENRGALALYQSQGFESLYLDLEKELSRRQ